jgi:hypothetical protein
MVVILVQLGQNTMQHNPCLPQSFLCCSNNKALTPDTRQERNAATAEALVVFFVVFDSAAPAGGSRSLWKSDQKQQQGGPSLKDRFVSGSCCSPFADATESQQEL